MKCLPRWSRIGTHRTPPAPCCRPAHICRPGRKPLLPPYSCQARPPPVREHRAALSANTLSAVHLMRFKHVSVSPGSCCKTLPRMFFRAWLQLQSPGMGPLISHRVSHLSGTAWSLGNPSGSSRSTSAQTQGVSPVGVQGASKARAPLRLVPVPLVSLSKTRAVEAAATIEVAFRGASPVQWYLTQPLCSWLQHQSFLESDQPCIQLE